MKLDYSGCASDSVRFEDITGSPEGRAVTRWHWELGDGSTSNANSFSHRYSTGGKFNVKLRVITDIGCISEVDDKLVQLENIPLASFENTVACEDREIIFSDKSDRNSGTITKWYWDLGDGRVDSAATGEPVVHGYEQGNYEVKLWLRNSKGCVSDTFSKMITVHELPRAAMGLPEVCLTDAFAQFRDSSTISDGSRLSYQWDFGDGGTSTEATPTHRYNASGNYSLRQVVTSANGCTDTASATFTVNGSLPESDFSITGADKLCSNRPVELSNLSSVDFGTITRLEIIWDMDDPGVSRVLDENPTKGKTYSYLYPSFGSPASRKVKIGVLAYSGETCVNERIREIELLGSPQLSFSAMAPLCADAELLSLSQGVETSGLPGTGYYAGSGITGTGQFDASTAGAGNHTISYIFNTNAGCSDTVAQTLRVNAVPLVDAGPDRSVLSGGYVVLGATATGPGIQWTWGPAMGIDDPGLLQPKVSPATDITYTLTVTTAEGCSASDAVFVKFLPDIKVPNTFTPNGDGINDVWEIRSLDTYAGSLMEVYSTAGQLMYRTVGYAKPWDGTYQGRAVPAGTYYYVIDPKNGRKKIAGYVTVIR
jgi:gliding motility-associated-like protein